MEHYITLFERDLERLKAEIRQYPKDEYLWVTEEGINNSAGNLVLHLVGNLNHFIGTVLGNTGYVRNREAEFNDGGYPATYLEKEVDKVSKVLTKTLKTLTEKQLKATYPVNVFGYEMSTEYFLIHLLGHLNYHLGQINYHRRLLI